MALVMPTLADNPSFDGMAVEDDVDIFARTSQASQTSVLIGCQVLQNPLGPNMQVIVTPGFVSIQGITMAYSGTGLSPVNIPAPSVGSRRDTIVLRMVNAATPYVTAVCIQGTVPTGLVGAWNRGTPPTTSLAPLKGPVQWPQATPQNAVDVSTDVILAEVYVEFNTTQITGTAQSIINPTTGNIVDKTNVVPNIPTTVQLAAWQNIPRRSGNFNTATVGDIATNFPYGQLEVVIGASVSEGTGSQNFGTTDWTSILANLANNSIGLPNAGRGFVQPVGGAGVYGLPQFSAAGANLVTVTGMGGGVLSNSGGPDFQTAVQFGAGTFASSTAAGAANSLTDNRTFGRVIIFYEPIANSDGIGVSVTGQGGATFATIDATFAAIAPGTTAQVPHGNSTVAYWDSGYITTTGPATALSLFRSSTHPTGSGGANPTILGVLYYGLGVAGNKGLSFINLGCGGTTSASWIGQRTWESLLSALGSNISRVHLELGLNDVIRAHASTTAAFNNSLTLTDANGNFAPADVGRPVTGNVNIPVGTYIAAYNSATQVTLNQATTGGNLTNQSVQYGQFPTLTTQNNLSTIVQRIRAQLPYVEVVVYGEYHTAAAGTGGYMPYGTWLVQQVPMYLYVALANNATYLDYNSRFGSVCSQTITDAQINTGSQIFTSQSQAQFSTADIGAIVTGTNIQANTVIQSVQTYQSCTLSKPALGNTSGNYTINHDVYGITFDNIHLGDYTNSASGVDGQRAQAEELIERLGYTHNIPSVLPAYGWTRDLGTWVRVSNTQFTITDVYDHTTTLSKSTYLRWTESGTIKYAVVASSSFNSGVTTVNMIPTTDFVMAANPDAGSNWYAYGKPPSLPQKFAFTPTLTGVSSQGTVVGYWNVHNGLITVSINVVAGLPATGNATTFTVSNLPVNSVFGNDFVGTGQDAGTEVIMTASTAASSATLTFGKSVAGGAWTASGNRYARVTVEYPF